MPNNESCANVPFRARTDLAITKTRRGVSVAGAVLAGAMLAGLLTAAATLATTKAEAGSQGAYIVARGAAATPLGASNLCNTYS